MINIQDIIPFMKKGWVAMDANKQWWFYEKKPKAAIDVWWNEDYAETCISSIFDIAPADDWTKSLIAIKGDGK